VSVEDLNDFIVTLKKGGMSPNTVLHNVIIIAQFCKRNVRSGITRQVHLPERISSLPRENTQEELAKFLASCNDAEVALFSTFLLTGFREQEVMYLGWPDVNQRLRTIRVTAKPDLSFFRSAGKRERSQCRYAWPIFSIGTRRRTEAHSSFLL
jgi:integrase